MKNIRVLVVEDESIVALSLQRKLENLGYDVPTIVASGVEAIEQVKQSSPDLILMDIMLDGDMDGIQAATEIRSHASTPVVYLTANSDPATIQRAKATEAFGYLLKPFEEKELHTTIEMALYKHQMEQQLKQSHQWLATTLRSIGDAVIATDNRGNIIFMNPIAEYLTGWSQSQAIGKRLDTVFYIVGDEDSQPIDLFADQRLSQAIREIPEQSVLIAQDGARRIIDATASSIQDTPKYVTGVVVVFRDITEQKQAERALLKSERTLRALHEVIANAALDFNEKTHVLLQIGCQQLGLPIGILAQANNGQHIITHVVTPKSLQLQPGNTASVNLTYGSACLGHQQPVSFSHAAISEWKEHPAYLHSGLEAFIGISVQVNHQPWGVLHFSDAEPHPEPFTPTEIEIVKLIAQWIGSEIARQQHIAQIERHAQQTKNLNHIGQTITANLDLDDVLAQVIDKLPQLVDAEGAVILLADDEHELTFAAASGPGAQGLMGKRMPSNAGIAGEVMETGHSIWINDEEQHSKIYHEAEEGYTTRALIAVPLRFGEQFIGILEAAHSQPQAFSTEDVNTLEAVAVWIAIAIQNARLYGKLAQALHQEQATRAQLVQSSKLASMGRMVASVAHELNNPLQVINNSLYIIRQRLNPRDKHAQHFMDIALAEIRRLVELTEQLHRVYRPKNLSQMQAVKLATLLSEFETLITPHLSSKQIDLQTNHPNPDLAINGNSAQLKQVFLNLSLNAADAMQPDGGTLTIDITPPTEQGQIGVTFQDTGKGIPLNLLASLFDPFFSTRETGTGLGLAICYDIIKSHGGQIDVDSREGQGSTFTVWLPLLSEDS